MVTRRRGRTVDVVGPQNQSIAVKFFDDGGVTESHQGRLGCRPGYG